MVNNPRQQLNALLEILNDNPEQGRAIVEAAGITGADIRNPNADCNDMVTKLETEMTKAGIDYSNVQVSQTGADTSASETPVETGASGADSQAVPGAYVTTVAANAFESAVGKVVSASGESASTQSDDSQPTTTQDREYASYNGEYEGNAIFYDEKVTADVKQALTDYNDQLGARMDEVAVVDKSFNGIGWPYSKLIPAPRFSAIQREVEEDLSAVQTKALNEISNVVTAIKDYSDGGDINPNSTETLSGFFAPRGNPKVNPRGGPSGSPSGVPTNTPVSSEENPNLSLEGSNIPGDTATDIPVLPSSTDDNLSNYGNTSSAVLGGGGLGTVAGSLSSNSDKDLSENSATLDDLGTSLFGSSDSRFIVPSFGTTVGKTDGVKSSGVVGIAGTAGAVIAAGAAIGGKVYYDKKKESGDEDDDEGESELLQDNDFNEEKDSELEEIKTNSDGIDFDLSGVMLKENILNLEKEDE